MGRSRFDPYDDEIDFCWCALCMEVASAHVAGIPYRLTEASEALYRALHAGTHTKQGPSGRTS